jgi:pimeloyl-ACP methyl ester carboxylesterase
MPLTLNYRSWGNGPPLVILHGLFGSAINWERIGKALSQRWSVFVLDLRNHGDSPHSTDFGYEVLIEDLRRFLEVRGIKTTNLLGHSLGGKIAMAFAHRYPARVDALIIVDIAPKPYPSGHRRMLQALIEFDLNPVDSLQDAVERLKPVIPSLAIRHFLVKNLVRGKDGGYGWKINLSAIHRHYGELSKGPRLTHRFQKPTLFVRGEASEFIIDEDAERIGRFFPNFKIVTIAQAGHWLHVDAPEETSQVIIDFLLSA